MLPIIALLLLSQTIEHPVAAPELLAEFQIGGGSGQSLALNAAGTMLASTGDEGDLLLYDLVHQQVLWTRQPSKHWLGDTCFSPDGTFIATVGENLVIYNLAGELVFSSPASSRACAAWNKAGTLFAYQCANKTIRILETENWSEVRTLPPVPYPAQEINFSIDGKKLLIGCNARYVLRFDLEAGDFDKKYQHPKASSGGQSIYQVIDVDGVILSAQSSGVIQVGEKSFATHVSLYDCGLTSDGKAIAICGGFPEVHIYDFEGNLIRKLSTGSSAASISFAKEQNLLAVGTASGAIQIWKDAEKIQELFLHPSEPMHLAFSANGNSILAVGKSSYFFDLNSKKGVSLQSTRSCTSGISGNEILCVEKDGVVFRNGSTGESIRRIPIDTERLVNNEHILLSPNGQYLAFGKPFGMYDFIVIDLVSGERNIVSTFRRTLDLAWTPDSQNCAVAGVSGNHGESGGWDIYSMAPGNEEIGKSPKLNDAIHSLCINSTGTRMLYAQSSNSMFNEEPATLHLWDLNQSKEILSRQGDFSFLRFLDDETLLALSYREPYAQFLDAVTLQPKGPELNLPVSYTSALSPDGKRLALIDETWVRIYQLPKRD